MFKWLNIIIFFSDRYYYFNFYKVVTVACSMLLRAAINMQMDALICPNGCSKHTNGCTKHVNRCLNELLISRNNQS